MVGSLRHLLAVAVVFAALAAPAAASASVTLIGVTPTVRAGGSVTLSVSVSPPAVCSIRVHYRTGGAIAAAGLSPSRGLFGKVKWQWTMSTRAKRGRWSADVSCGGSGVLHTSFLVR